MSSAFPIPVLVLFGPTASGKTEVLETLFTSAGAFSLAEIISADSMQVYRGMDIGTAKPSRELRARLPHHLIDVRAPDELFNAGDFVHLASELCVDIAARGKLPVLSGGTGFYLKNFVQGLPAAPSSDALIRRELREELSLRGAPALAKELAGCDPISAARIHINDEYRLLRALEVFRLTGKPLSSFAMNGQSALSRYRFLLIGLERPREELYRRINERCAAMFRAGLANEVRRLFEVGYTPKDPGLRAIGYHEFFEEDAAGNFTLKTNLDEVESLVARDSRHYAKRQITYFASLANNDGQPVHWVSAADAPVERIRVDMEKLFMKQGHGLMPL
ncbi:MAG: tRNA (adenosine(37)-N6)-dimethylallyltransferase MiaA [Treponema sp.]|nr:tRNA (adenosine(37)-N6)-dimethylallyltransferase MiaA [Treponema sp.]